MTDSHLNFWKTLNNWLKPDFDPVKYKSLLLVTTQNYGEKTSFRDWNGTNSANRLTILLSIRDDALENIDAWRTEYNTFISHSSLGGFSLQEMCENSQMKSGFSTLAMS